ncbi:cold shock domain-containing protein [Candidatus Woesearchaeota archaeon]|nr:cold shock domain-containing protein [Candidatus Woesearchaeota archaeon]
MKGTVKFFNEMKGFGFIAGEDGKEYFVHKTGLNEGVTLRDNDSVTFDIGEGDRGPKAVNVSKGGSHSKADDDNE